MAPDTFVIVTARNEADRLGATLDALSRAFPGAPLWVADDGSTDATAELARAAGARVVRGPRALGKGQAATAAAYAALGEAGGRRPDARAIALLCDGDLGESAARLRPLVEAVSRGEAELAVAAFARRVGGGLGIAVGFAGWAIGRRCGLRLRAPISGQRALRVGLLEQVLPFADGFGMEIAMTIDAARTAQAAARSQASRTAAASSSTSRGSTVRASEPSRSRGPAASLDWVWRPVTLAALAALLCVAIPALSSSSSQPDFELGIVSNVNARSLAGTIGRLGAPVARVEFRIDSTPRQIAPVVAAFARHDVRVLPLASFYGRTPTTAEAQGLAAWARAFGPGGTFWSHRSDGRLAVHDIEFGNETNMAYQFRGCQYGCDAYTQRARAYALAAKTAQEAIDAPGANPRVGLLAIGDDAGTDSADWVEGMFSAVPDLDSRVAGWTAHTYGPRSRWQPVLDQLSAQMQPHGVAATLPVYITELGIATDGGPCLSDNFGWSPCLTYRQAAQALTGTVGAIRARYGARIRAIFLYQAVDQRLPRVDGDREHYFGVLAANRTAKGAYTAAVRSLLATLR